MHIFHHWIKAYEDHKVTDDKNSNRMDILGECAHRAVVYEDSSLCALQWCADFCGWWESIVYCDVLYDTVFVGDIFSQ